MQKTLATSPHLTSLIALSHAIDRTLDDLPKAHAAGTTDFSVELPASQVQDAITVLQRSVDEYWSADHNARVTRRAQLTTDLETAARHELAYRIERGEIHQAFAACMPEPLSAEVTVTSLALKLNDTTTARLYGSLSFNLADERTLVVLPGLGIHSAATRNELLARLTAMLNDPGLRHSLTRLLAREYQDLLDVIEADASLTLERFEPGDWRFTPLQDDPFQSALDSLIDRQRGDIAHVIASGPSASSTQGWQQRIDDAVRLQPVLGPANVVADMLEKRAQRHLRIPQWFKYADPEQRRATLIALQHYESNRNALISLLGEAASLEHFAAVRLQARIANDLGHDVDPERILVSTRRSLPYTAEPYETQLSLVQLALLGLHPGDEIAGSDFLEKTSFSLAGKPLSEIHSGLTCAYVAGIVDSLGLRKGFASVQKAGYASAKVKELMTDTLRSQLRAQAWQARLQGHITADDQQWFEALAQGNTPAIATVDTALLSLDGHSTLDNVMIVRKRDSQGQDERLLMFCPDIPRAQTVYAFDNERRLLEELIGWLVRPESKRFLIDSTQQNQREALTATLDRLTDRPEPDSRFITLTAQPDMSRCLGALVNRNIDTRMTERQTHTPDWYMQASDEHARTLLQLEDAINAARSLYAEKPHTQVIEFETYVEQRAREKINRLLGNPNGNVDPNRIIIQSPRERLSYTQLLRHGYDDSFGLLNPTADTTASFTGPEGVDLSALTPETVAGSVRGAWLSDSYLELLERTLLDEHTQGYAWRRRHSLLTVQLEMQHAALLSLLRGQVTSEQYQWLLATIQTLHDNDKAVRQRHPVYPLQLHLENSLIASAPELGEALNLLFDISQAITPTIAPLIVHIENVLGCHVLAPQAGNARQALIYTPRAPDGVMYRPLSSFASSLHQPGMSNYYKDRCSLKADRVLAFFLADMSKGGKSKPPALPDSVHSNLQEVCYDRPLRRKMRDVQALENGRDDLIARLAWNTFELAAAVVTLPFPPAAFAVGVVMAARDSYQAFRAFADGDQATASAYIL